MALSPGVRRLMRLPSSPGGAPNDRVEDEIAFHLTMRTQRLISEGMAPDDAWAEAARRFGMVGEIRDECVTLEHRYTKRTAFEAFVEELITDLRFGLRALRRSPGFTAAALLTLVLGTASITTVFSIVNAVWRPLPYPDSDRIVAIGQDGPSARFPEFNSVPLPVADLLRTDNHSFERLATYQFDRVNTLVAGAMTQIGVIGVDSAFRAMLGTAPAAGRWFTPDEIRGNAPVAVISDDLWRRLGGTRAAFDTPLRLDEQLYTVVGVMPPGFEFPDRTKIWRPLASHTATDAPTIENGVAMLAKLKPGVTRAVARHDLAALSRRLGRIDPTFAHDSLIMRDEMLDRGIRPVAILMLAFFLGAGFFVLMIVCTNVSTLMVARTAERQTEMAVRASLGAGRWRLTRQLLAESLVLAIVAGVVGTLASIAGVRILLAIVPHGGFPSWIRFSVDVRVLGFTMAITLLVTGLVGMLPVRTATQLDLVSALKNGTAGGGRSRALALGSRRGLIVQLSLSMALVLATGLMVRGYQRAATFDYGFPADKIVTVGALFTEPRYATKPSPAEFMEDVAARLRQSSGETTIGVWSSIAPLMTRATAAKARTAPPAREVYWNLHGDGVAPSISAAAFHVTAIPDNYFDILGIHLVSGRAYSAADVEGSLPVAIISRSLAITLFGTANPIGRTLYGSPQGDRFTIVGVAEDARSPATNPRQAKPSLPVYVAVRQVDVLRPELIARARDVEATKRLLVSAMRGADPDLATMTPSTLDGAADEVMRAMRVLGSLLAFFALSGLLLSMIGIYGVVSYGITQRTREIGIRMALGGTGSAIVRLLLRQGVGFTATGVVIGLVISAAVAKLLQGIVGGTVAFDPPVYVAAALFFAGVSMLACYLPARRAAQVDPLVALRAE